jgi:signal transduction histidine kinase
VLADIAKLAPSSTAAGFDLAEVALSVGNALDAEECRITVVRHSLSDRTYRWSRSGTDEAPALLSVPIRHGDEQIGTLAVEHAAVVGMHADRRQLLEDIAGVLGTVVEAHRIGIELERQLRAAVAHSAEIASSRRTAVSEMDAERRRIERDLHDGVQHYLVSGRLALGLVEFDAKSGRTEAAVQRLDTLMGQLDAAERVLTETVGGVRSMLLTDHGLAVALDLELAGAASPVSVTADVAPGRRYPPDVESAVFLCCLESVNNAVKHAPGAPVTVRIAESGGTLRFTITDSGPGFVPPAGAGQSSGRGLRNVRRRITDVGGWLSLSSEPGRGTIVDGVVPVPAHEPTHATEHVRAGASVTSVQRIVGPGSRANLPGISVVAQRGGHAGPESGLDGEEQTVRHADLPRVPLDDEDTERLPEGFAGEQTAPQPGRSLVAEARALITSVRMAVDPAVVLELVAIESALQDPLRVGFLGPPGADMTVLVRAVLPTGPSPGVEPVAVTDAHLPGLDAVVIVEGGRGGAMPGVPTIVVAEPGPGPDADPPSGVQVRWRMACAAGYLTEADLAALRAGRPVPQLPPADHRVAVASAREARTLADFRADLIARSGVPMLRTVLQQRVFAHADLLRCQRAIRGLSAMAPRLRPDDARHRLSYELERLVAARHELAESALLDALRSGDAQLKGPDRSAALRLLGAAGTSVTDRLGLPAVAAPRDVAFAARAELARWQRIAANPIAPGARHRAASVLIRTCEEILAHPLVAATVTAGLAAQRRTGARAG